MKEKKHPPYISLKLAFAGKGLKYKDIATVLGVTETTLMLKINGDSDFYVHEQQTICKEFGIDSSVFFEVFVA